MHGSSPIMISCHHQALMDSGHDSRLEAVNERRVKRVLVFTQPFVVVWPLRIKSRKLFVLDTHEATRTSRHPLSWLQCFYADGIQSIK